MNSDLAYTMSCDAVWPSLTSLGLSSAQIAKRKDFIGGSDANVIFGSDESRMLQLWKQKTGQALPEDLSTSLPVMLGNWTESFNRQWFERVTKLPVSDVGGVWTDPRHPWRRATLDGFLADRAGVWEAKHVSAFRKPEEVLTRYMPQLQHNMAVVGVDHATLSVIYGNHKWECVEIAADWLYQDALLDAEQRFWEAVALQRPPVALPAPPAPKPEAWREVNLSGNNLWAAAAADWLETVEAAKLHAGAIKQLKDLIADDVRRAHGHGVEARRSKVGAITIKALAA